MRTILHVIVPAALLLLVFAPLVPTVAAVPQPDIDCDGGLDTKRSNNTFPCYIYDAEAPWGGSWGAGCKTTLGAPEGSCSTTITECKDRACESRSKSVAWNGTDVDYRDSGPCGDGYASISLPTGVKKAINLGPRHHNIAPFGDGGTGIDNDCDGVASHCALGISVTEPSLQGTAGNATGSTDCNDATAACAADISVNEEGGPSEAACAGGSGDDGAAELRGNTTGHPGRVRLMIRLLANPGGDGNQSTSGAATCDATIEPQAGSCGASAHREKDFLMPVDDAFGADGGAGASTSGAEGWLRVTRDGAAPSCYAGVVRARPTFACWA